MHSLMPHFVLHMDIKSICGSACFYTGYKKTLSRVPGAAGKLTGSERIKHAKEMRSLHHPFNLSFRRGVWRGGEGGVWEKKNEPTTKRENDRGRKRRRETKQENNRGSGGGWNT